VPARLREMSEYTYDSVPYPSMVFPHIRPDQIGAISSLHGVRPDSIEDCRVLELGCGDGTNLLSIAYTMPESHCVGFDLSAPRIQEAKNNAGAIGIANAEFHHLDLLDYEPDKFGEFDFIIAHGVYSWVPEPVREKILWIYEQSLKPNGVGFISYNLYPGWHLREMVREAMRFQTELIDDPQSKVANALRFVEFLKETSKPGSLYRSLLEEQFTYLGKQAPESIFHDDLAAINQPFYFRQFVEQVENAGLQFISELEPMSMFTDDLPSFAQEALEKLWDDPKRREQYLDFIRGRLFRSTLLCRRNRSGQWSYRALPKAIESLFFATKSLPSEPLSSLTDGSEVAFSAEERHFETDHPLVKSLLGLLGSHWPRRFSFPEIEESLNIGSDGSSGAKAETERVILWNALVRLITANIIEPRCFRPRISLSVSQEPKVSDFARWQAACGFASRGDLSGVTSMHGANIPIENDVLRELIFFSDGTRDHSDLAAAIIEKVKVRPEEKDAFALSLPGTIESNLEILARSALLIS